MIRSIHAVYNHVALASSLPFDFHTILARSHVRPEPLRSRCSSIPDMGRPKLLRQPHSSPQTRWNRRGTHIHHPLSTHSNSLSFSTTTFTIADPSVARWIQSPIRPPHLEGHQLRRALKRHHTTKTISVQQ